MKISVDIPILAEHRLGSQGNTWIQPVRSGKTLPLPRLITPLALPAELVTASAYPMPKMPDITPISSHITHINHTCFHLWTSL